MRADEGGTPAPDPGEIETPADAGKQAQAGSSGVAGVSDPALPTGSREWVRYLSYAVWGAFLLRIVVVLLVSRGWFFTPDDWDFITREWSEVLNLHAGHFTVVSSAWALAARTLVGLDYWPGYALLQALAWPLVGLAAWHVWGWMGVDIRWRAAGSVLLMWLGSSAWIQFGHAGAGVAVAATMIAIYLDEKPFRPRFVALDAALTLVAVFASSGAALIASYRAGLSAVYRKWTGLVAAGLVTILYVLGRVFVGEGSVPSTFGVGLRALGDVLTTLRAGLEVLGFGLREIVPWPASLTWVLGLLLLVVAVGTIVMARWSYFSVALVGGAAVYFAVSFITRFLGRQKKLDPLLSGEWNSLTGPRFANLVLALVVFALVPLLATRIARNGWPLLVMSLLLALVLGFGLVRSFDTFGAIARKSENPQAALTAQLFEMRAAGEPAYPSEYLTITPLLSQHLTVETMDEVIRNGWLDSMLSSDIYRIGDIGNISEQKVRGLLRMHLSVDRMVYGTWADLGREIDGCLLIEGSDKFSVSQAVRFRLELASDEPVVLRWTDEYGVGTREIGAQELDELHRTVADSTVRIEVPSPGPGGEPATLVVKSAAASMCLD
ncbi:MAG: hypothetical protein ABIJ75_07655 [Actinomycetota bacterium]